MYKKASHIRLTLMMLLCFTFFLQAENYENAFSAIFSLHYHINDIILDTVDNDKIEFSEVDIANLWKRAFSHPETKGQIQEAYTCYTKALNQDKAQRAHTLYKRAKTLLEASWYALHPYAEKCDVDKRALYPYFNGNPYLDNAMRIKMKPYLLPLDHELKPALDEIFDKSRAIRDPRSFAKAGFITLHHQWKTSRIRVAKHADLPGYLIKVYLDSDFIGRKNPGWDRLTRRCQGADYLHRLIKKKNIKHFIVPDKWLYPLPISNIFSKKKRVQPVILAVKDMDIVKDRQKRIEIWKNEVTKKHLNELYCILSHGLASAYLIDNIAYTKYGQFACVDTEYPKISPIGHVKRYFSPKMKAYWDILIIKGGNH